MTRPASLAAAWASLLGPWIDGQIHPARFIPARQGERGLRVCFKSPPLSRRVRVPRTLGGETPPLRRPCPWVQSDQPPAGGVGRSRADFSVCASARLSECI